MRHLHPSAVYCTRSDSFVSLWAACFGEPPTLFEMPTSPRTPTYNSWRGMIWRCENPNASRWKQYGGRGIRVCERWRRSFKDFLADMGERPEGYTLGRIDVNGNYEPDNCQWETQLQQDLNKQNTVF